MARVGSVAFWQFVLPLALFAGAVFGFNPGQGSIRTCYLCNSRDNPDCGTNVRGVKTTVECPGAGDLCAVGEVNKTVYRGCMSALEFLNSKAVCHTDLCNTETWLSYDVDQNKTENGTVSGDEETVVPTFTPNDDIQDVSLPDETTTTPIDDTQTTSQSNEKTSTPKDDTNEITMPMEDTTITTQANEIITTSTTPKVDIETSSKATKTTTTTPKNNFVRLDCIQCDSSKDERCVSMASELKGLECPGEAVGCYARKEDRRLVRGCASELSASDLSDCKANTNTCLFCTDPKCNTDAWPQCYNCTSAVFPNCAQWRNDGENVRKDVCDQLTDICGVRVNIHGDTIRSCKRKNSVCDKRNVCETCSSCNNCNSGVFPTNRTSCYQCSGSKECGLGQDTKTASFCANYKENDGCFMYANATGKMTRGCLSDAAGYTNCKQLGDRCKTCRGDGCNSDAMMAQPKLSCSKCGMDEEACPWQQREDTVSKCTKPFLYYLEETCRVLYTNDSVVKAERGCSLDLGVCADGDTTCTVCRGDGCNTGAVVRQSCVQCDSQMSNETSCGVDAAGIGARECQSRTQFYDNRGCYVHKSESGVTRGCVSDLPADVLATCSDPAKPECTLCLGQNCNTRDLSKSGTGRLLLSTFSMLSITTVIVKNFYF